jgi:hypothetical protein
MNNIGSSALNLLGITLIGIGSTGATGPIGITGATGAGLTGNTGPSIVGITLINRYVVTTFSNGNTYATPSKAYGTTGAVNYIIDYQNRGTGVSLAHSVSGTVLNLRPIKFVNNTDVPLTVQDNSTNITIDFTTTAPSGITLTSLDDKSYLLKFKNKKAVRVNGQGTTAASGTITGLAFSNANMFERVRGMGWTGSTGAVNCSYSANGITCTINPFIEEYDGVMYGSKSRIYVGDFNGNTGSIILKGCPDDGYAYGLELHIRNCKNPNNLTDRFTTTDSSIIDWPLNKTPCFSVDGVTCSMRVSFFGIKGKWYGTAKSTNSACVGATLFYTNCTVPPRFTFTGSLTNNITILGACCKADGTCSLTTADLCDGYYHGYGTTCGNTYDSICNKPGACCFTLNYTSSTDSQVLNQNQWKFCNSLSCSDCLNFGTPTSLYTTKFAGNGTDCTTTNCDDLQLNLGACCDGKGNCSEITREACIAKSGFYQGNGSVCITSGVSVCAGGTGPCCVNGDCSENSATNCFANNGYYLGLGRACSEFTCPTKVSCLGFIDGVPIYPGQEYGGGIVVGIFDPGTTEILGAKDLFSPAGDLALSGITTYNSVAYTSFLDHTAYGITKENCNLGFESYIIIVYPHDLYENTTVNNKFAWGGTGSAWGPLLDNGYNDNDFKLYDTVNNSTNQIYYANTHLRFNEGYWGISGATSINNDLTSKTFQTCSSAKQYGISGKQRVFSKSPYGMHGVWHQSWGLYNTVRAISAYNAYNSNASLGGVYSASDFTGVTATNAFIATRKISDGITSDTQGITANTGKLSNWYLPSHDELAFIAASTKSIAYNINTHLLMHNGDPLNGIYWTSTGTFDYTKSEGVYNGTKPTPGSVAVAMQIDINSTDYKVFKSNRQEQYKVRPIRYVRCDSETPENRYLWLIPTVYSTTINRPVNKRNIDTISYG